MVVERNNTAFSEILLWVQFNILLNTIYADIYSCNIIYVICILNAYK